MGEEIRGSGGDRREKSRLVRRFEIEQGGEEGRRTFSCSLRRSSSVEETKEKKGGVVNPICVSGRTGERGGRVRFDARAGGGELEGG